MTYKEDVRDGTTQGDTAGPCHLCGERATAPCVTCGRLTCWECAQNPGVCLECVAREVSAEVAREEAAIAEGGG